MKYLSRACEQKLHNECYGHCECSCHEEGGSHDRAKPLDNPPRDSDHMELVP